MVESYTLCPICKEEIPKKVVEVWGEYEIIRCSLCDVEFAEPFRSASPQDYDEVYKESGKKQRLPLYDGFMDVYTVLYKMLKPAKVKGRLLDAGCGRGYFLHLMRGLGFEVYGFDFSKVAVDLARKVYGLENVVVCSWEDIPNDWRDFSLITAIHILEHLDKPFEFVLKMKELFSPNGTLIIAVPNRERVGERSLYKIAGNYPPNHLTRWSGKALAFLLRRAGFKKVIVKPLAPPTVAIKEEYRFWLAPSIYGTLAGKILTKPISETLGRYVSFFLRHLLWDKGADLLGIAKC